MKPRQQHSAGLVSKAAPIKPPTKPLVKSWQGVTPTFHPRSYLAEGTAVIGNVTLGEEANIWYGAVLRGDDHSISIGARTNIQDRSVVHVTINDFPTRIGDDVVVGHGAILHGCTVGNRTLIGIGAVLLDGCRVEEDAWVGAGALVAPGKVVSAGELWVGNPAHKIRMVNDAERAWAAEDVAHYLKIASVQLKSAMDWGLTA